MLFNFMMSSGLFHAEQVARSVQHAADLGRVRHDHGLVHAAQAETARRGAVPVQLSEGALHERDADALGALLGHVGQPVISATVLPRLAAIRSGAGTRVRAFMVARTTLMGLREP